jgi:hypothetical protein
MAPSFALETMSRSTFMNPGGAFDFMANVCSDQPNPAKSFGFFLKVPFLRIGGNSDLRGCPPGEDQPVTPLHSEGGAFKPYPLVGASGGSRTFSSPLGRMGEANFQRLAEPPRVESSPRAAN